MRIALLIGGAALLAGCASAGTSSIYPEAGDPNAAITNAQRLITEAQQAGGDSLAADAMAAARQNLASAQAELNTNHNGDRAAMRAREAAADATFAKAAAARAMAMRQQTEAQTALSQLPPEGGAL